MKTIWRSESNTYDKLNSDYECDTAIIGGGIAGLWCAYNLVNAGQRVCILEAKQIGSGVTAGSTAILTYAQDIIYNPLIKKHGTRVAKKYLEDTKQAISDIAEIIKTNNVDCELESIDFVLFTTKLLGSCALKKERKAYAKLWQDVEELTRTQLPYKTKRALRFKNNYQFNPLKLCNWLAGYITKKGGHIFENTHVSEAPADNTLRVNNHAIRAKNFIVATHFPYINAPGFYWLKMYQDQNYAMAFRPSRAYSDLVKNTSYESIDETGFEYRKVGDMILVDGVSVRTGQKPYRSKYRIIEKHLGKHFGEYKEVARFCAQDCITMDKLPYAGLYSHFADNVFVVTGFNKWGMTNSYITAQTVCDMILGKLHSNASVSDNIYSPQRVALFVNLIEAVSNVATIAASFANNILNVDAKKFQRIKPGQGAVMKYRGQRVGASRDDDGTVHLISAICPHMGCNLKWNKDERTFDCPCHGSRFDTHGNIINNPSTKNAERIKDNV
jgi:glycine/D-amino acid oxidase-like deaminating enzyme/nitrite reductase/ring-hydroxylating ferredoxin subunit